MSFMKGDLLTKTRKLVKGLAKAEPAWLKAMEKAPPVAFPGAENIIEPIVDPSDPYTKKFYQKHPDSLYHDPKNLFTYDQVPSEIFASRVLKLKEHDVAEEEAMAVADMEYRNEKRARKKAYKRLKEICRLQGKKPPPNPYPSAIKEIQAEEKKYVKARFFDPNIRKIVQQMKEDSAATYSTDSEGMTPKMPCYFNSESFCWWM